MIPTSPSRGLLMAVGGAEDKLGRRAILARFVELAGGARARIAVLATASSISLEALDLYDRVLGELGARRVYGLRPDTRRSAEDDAVVQAVLDCTGLFMTGGNQLKLSAIVAGTRLGAAIRQVHARGTIVAGTSAGASAMSEHMIAFGSAGTTPKNRMGQLSAGLGLLPGVIVDQHFTQRNRIGRLLAMVANSPSQLGLGVDEDTAALIRPDGELQVLGRGAVTVVDGALAESNAFSAKATAPLLVSGAVLHVLPAGARFDLAGRRLLAPHPDSDHPPVLRAHEGQVSDVRAASRRIALEGVDDELVLRNDRRRARRVASLAAAAEDVAAEAEQVVQQAARVAEGDARGTRSARRAGRAGAGPAPGGRR